MVRYLFSLQFIFAVQCFGINNEAILSPKPEINLYEYALFQDAQANLPDPNLVPYELITPLFSDYSDKERFVYVPKGKKATFRANDVYQFPVGSVLVKTFSYTMKDGQKKKLETRLLLHQEAGWKAHTYVWNEAQDKALLKVAGYSFDDLNVLVDGNIKKVNYRTPNQNQCKECHLKQDAISPIGPKSRNLNFTILYENTFEENQTDYWVNRGLVEAHEPVEAIANWLSQNETLNDRARAYLDVNCGHCHMPGGSADTTNLFLNHTEDSALRLGINKKPVAAGRASGNMQFSIEPGKPEESILLYRMMSLDPGVMMPESGRQMNHSEGIDLIYEWITSLK